MLILGSPGSRGIERVGLPNGSWGGRKWCDGVVFEDALRLRPRGRLLVKVLVFGSPGAAVEFGRAFRYGGDVRGCHGWVMECMSVDGAGDYWVDPRYVCVVGFVLERLSLDVVAHEAVHAALCWGRRTGFRFPWPGAGENNEEHIAWPTGMLTSMLAERLVKSGILGV